MWPSGRGLHSGLGPCLAPWGLVAGRRLPLPNVSSTASTPINLSEQQERQLRETFETGRLRFRAIYQETRERFDTEQEQMDGEIRAILTPEQLDTYENEIMRMGPDRRGSRRRNGFRPPRRRGPP